MDIAMPILKLSFLLVRYISLLKNILNLLQMYMSDRSFECTSRTNFLSLLKDTELAN